ncbi:MAG: iron complex outermembrane receptor protein [Rheinheimera aquimaris]|jgi:iron complex outermembrane receptor protein
MKRIKIFHLVIICFYATSSSIALSNIELENLYQSGLEEIMVTAQKYPESMQDTPIAMSVMSSTQLDLQGITDLGGLSTGMIPSLRIMPIGSTPSNLIIAIRGNAPSDVSEVTRDGSVGIYLDGVYLARSHGFGLELPDLERIEVLRGPQGTLFGRNSVGGAVSLISKKPSGQLGLKQVVSMGRFNELRSVTRLDLPEMARVKVKLDYLHSERDGWVDNTAPGQADYNAYNKDGGKLSVNWQPRDEFAVDYSYDNSSVEMVQEYMQFYKDNLGSFSEERERLTETRLPVSPLKPTVVEQQGHSVAATWVASDHLTIKSISAVRNLKEDSQNNYAGVLYFNGLLDLSIMEQDQYSQELQLIGRSKQIDWVAGLYYLKEDVNKFLQDSFSLDIFGIFGAPLSPIDPPTTFDALGAGAILPPRIVDAEARSRAAYGQFSWAPNGFDERMELTVGGRYTEDKKIASRFETSLSQSRQDSENFDSSIALRYQWQDDLSTYLKWGTAYKAGGVNTRSASFDAFEEELAKTWEIGLKSEFWGHRARVNVALFTTDYDDMQLDFSDPVLVTLVETINASETVEISGAEVDITLSPMVGLLLGLSYTYLDSDMPLQPNPLNGGALKQFFVPLAPQHAGSITLDYRFEPQEYGSLALHVDMTSTDHYSYVPFGEQRTDAYSLLNARLELGDINVGGTGGGHFKASIWAKNLRDEQYVIYAFPVGDPAVSVAQAFGTPRTVGLDISYMF